MMQGFLGVLWVISLVLLAMAVFAFIDGGDAPVGRLSRGRTSRPSRSG